MGRQILTKFSFAAGFPQPNLPLSILSSREERTMELHTGKYQWWKFSCAAWRGGEVLLLEHQHFQLLNQAEIVRTIEDLNWNDRDA